MMINEKKKKSIRQLDGGKKKQALRVDFGVATLFSFVLSFDDDISTSSSLRRKREKQKEKRAREKNAKKKTMPSPFVFSPSHRVSDVFIADPGRRRDVPQDTPDALDELCGIARGTQACEPFRRGDEGLERSSRHVFF